MIDDQITVLIPTSPIPSHPDTGIIEKVISSVRFHLPSAFIVLMADGLREEVKHREEQYKRYLHKLQCLVGDNTNMWLKCFREHTHQAAMMCETLKYVNTPLVLFNEHDAHLVTDFNPRDAGGQFPEDCTINWQDIHDLIVSGGANVVRFYLWEQIWHEHKHLMHGQMIQGSSRFIQTRQYSGWPNVGSADFYRRVLKQHFAPGQKRMVELGLVGPIENAAWEDYRVTLYYPGINNRRFYHMNGRWDEKTNTRDMADGGVHWR